MGHGSLGTGGLPAGRYGVLTRAIDASDNIAVARERSLTVKLKTAHA